ncbi:hypothetical protein [Halomonas cerina]|uniref:Uncharacterized protein n=1 Tax=Halomonas cerina TaxID=447424 RepID=A0A839VBV6_9GAMM|nr:hypothetical protein [Halomonas cerina]MBB3190187.1 hypothetical protein [Halomonas cerina]
MSRRLRSLLAAVLLLAGCAELQDAGPITVRQALFGLGERAAERVAEAPPLPQPPIDQVLLLAMPEVDTTFSLAPERLLESLTRALLGLEPGPQVLDWGPSLAQGGGENQWRLDSRLVADGPRLTLSDRTLLPYRLQLSLRRPGGDRPLWSTELAGALDASAL